MDVSLISIRKRGYNYIKSERMSSAVAVKTDPVRFKAAAPGQADLLN